MIFWFEVIEELAVHRRPFIIQHSLLAFLCYLLINRFLYIQINLFHLFINKKFPDKKQGCVIPAFVNIRPRTEKPWTCQHNAVAVFICFLYPFTAGIIKTFRAFGGIFNN